MSCQSRLIELCRKVENSPKREVSHGSPPDLHCFDMKDLLALISEENTTAAKRGYAVGFKDARKIVIDLRASGEAIPDIVLEALNKALYYKDMPS